MNKYSVFSLFLVGNENFVSHQTPESDSQTETIKDGRKKCVMSSLMVGDTRPLLPPPSTSSELSRQTGSAQNAWEGTAAKFSHRFVHKKLPALLRRPEITRPRSPGGKDPLHTRPTAGDECGTSAKRVKMSKKNPVYT